MRGRGWHSGRRARTNRNAFIDKVRWGKTLHPRKRAATTAKSERDKAARTCDPANPWLTDGRLSVSNPFAPG